MMWKDLYNYLRLIFTLAQQMQRNSDEIRELQHSFRALCNAMARLELRMEYHEKQLAAERESFRRELAAEREKFKLQLENLMLRYLQKLPPSEGQEE